MLKNVIIGILAVLSFFLFYYGQTQQFKAENYNALLMKSESAALRQKETLEAAVAKAEEKTLLVMKELDECKK